MCKFSGEFDRELEEALLATPKKTESDNIPGGREITP